MNTTATLAAKSVTDLGAVVGMCDRCGRGIRYAVTMSNGDTYGMDCAESAISGRKVRATAATFRQMKAQLEYARRLEWEASDPANAEFAARFIEHARFYELREYRADFYAATLTADQMAEADAIIADL